MYVFPLLRFGSLFLFLTSHLKDSIKMGNSPSHSRTRSSMSLGIPSFHLGLFSVLNFPLYSSLLGGPGTLLYMKLDASSSIRFAECVPRTFSWAMLV